MPWSRVGRKQLLRYELPEELRGVHVEWLCRLLVQSRSFYPEGKNPAIRHFKKLLERGYAQISGSYYSQYVEIMLTAKGREAVQLFVADNMVIPPVSK